MNRALAATILAGALTSSGCQYLCIGEYYIVPLLMIGTPVLPSIPEFKQIPFTVIDPDDVPRCVYKQIPVDHPISRLTPTGAWRFGYTSRDRLDADYCKDRHLGYAVVYKGQTNEAHIVYAPANTSGWPLVTYPTPQTQTVISFESRATGRDLIDAAWHHLTSQCINAGYRVDLLESGELPLLPYNRFGAKDANQERSRSRDWSIDHMKLLLCIETPPRYTGMSFAEPLAEARSQFLESLHNSVREPTQDNINSMLSSLQRGQTLHLTEDPSLSFPNGLQATRLDSNRILMRLPQPFTSQAIIPMPNYAFGGAMALGGRPWLTALGPADGPTPPLEDLSIFTDDEAIDLLQRYAQRQPLPQHLALYGVR